ncbi:hypothetical protein CASFOL_015894 [Castilleja foliolosa]|uniref:Uncharacterized protein n=1 Tax=Castilleja foliolosa TaxID=1961234 RepID=A0ABD3DF17_9LAMI
MAALYHIDFLSFSFTSWWWRLGRRESWPRDTDGATVIVVGQRWVAWTVVEHVVYLSWWAARRLRDDEFHSCEAGC